MGGPVRCLTPAEKAAGGVIDNLLSLLVSPEPRPARGTITDIIQAAIDEAAPKWQEIESALQDPEIMEGKVVLAYWRDIPVLVAHLPEDGWRVLTLYERSGVISYAINGSFAPFSPAYVQPLPQPPEDAR